MFPFYAWRNLNIDEKLLPSLLIYLSFFKLFFSFTGYTVQWKNLIWPSTCTRSFVRYSSVIADEEVTIMIIYGFTDAYMLKFITDYFFIFVPELKLF